MYDKSREMGNLYVKSCNINLRSANKIKLKSQLIRLTKVQRSPFYRGLDLWNALPDGLQHEPSKTKFKCKIKRHHIMS